MNLCGLEERDGIIVGLCLPNIQNTKAAKRTHAHNKLITSQ